MSIIISARNHPLPGITLLSVLLALSVASLFRKFLRLFNLTMSSTLSENHKFLLISQLEFSDVLIEGLLSCVFMFDGSLIDRKFRTVDPIAMKFGRLVIPPIQLAILYMSLYVYVVGWQKKKEPIKMKNERTNSYIHTNADPSKSTQRTVALSIKLEKPNLKWQRKVLCSKNALQILRT